MPKNRVHFKKDLSIPAFLESYGREELCERALFEARWPAGLECPAYGSDEV